MAKAAPWGFVLIFLTIVELGTSHGDSLKSAINAMDRRQRDLSERPSYYDLYSEGGLNRYSKPRDDRNRLAFLPIHQLDDVDDKPQKSGPLDLLLLDYLAETGLNKGKPKRISSSFRERLEEDRERQREEYAKLFINSLNANRDLEDEDYKELLQEIWDQYQQAGRPEINDVDYYGDIKKRGYYYNNYMARKRETTPNDLYLYAPREELFNRYEEEDQNENYEDEYPSRRYDPSRSLYPYSFTKRFPVAKRSSEFYTQHKRSTPKKEKTDPKVEKELSGIFGTKTDKKPEKLPTKPKKTETTDAKPKKRTAKVDSTKEATTTTNNDEKIQLKKKSIDWSDYFGFNRRKKSDENLDNEWLMERYHKSMALTAKRSNEYPLEHFVNHDSDKPTLQSKSTDDKNNVLKSEEAKIHEMDEKLKSLEDSVLDDTLKYAGAHEGLEDSKDIQEVKDRVISRLAAAYNLEKMRRALGEYKLEMAKEKNRLKQLGPADDYLFTEEKRVSVPRKQAIDEEMSKAQEEENNIKCIHGGAKCDDQNYRLPSDVLERYNWRVDECPRVQRACNDFAITVGKYERELEASCNIHQLCLLCDDNNWYPPTRKCNSLFLAKSTVLCQGNEDCQKTAQRSLAELILLNSSLKGDPLDECNLFCPENRR